MSHRKLDRDFMPPPAAVVVLVAMRSDATDLLEASAWEHTLFLSILF